MSSTVERTGEPMSGSGVPLPHETRFVPLTKAKAEQVLPYVLKSIQTWAEDQRSPWAIGASSSRCPCS